MSAIDYFNPPKVKLVPISKLVPEREFNECHRLNYSLIALVTRELADSLSVYAKRNIVSSKDVAYFEKMANEDNDMLFSLYEKHGFTHEASEDFERVVSLFRGLAGKSLSVFQRNSDPMLQDILALVYSIRYLKIAIRHICNIIRKVPEANTYRILEEKESELKYIFINRYRNVSNAKEFDFDKFDETYRKVLKMNRNEFIKYTNEIT